jgi:hypothetical protein
MTRRKILSFAILACAVLSAAMKSSAQKVVNFPPPEKSSYKFADRDWDVMISQLHTDKPTSDAQIKSFVMAMIGEPADEPFGSSVCSAGFFKIAESESESLVASIDINGRHFCNDLEVIHRGANGVMIQDANMLEQGLAILHLDDVNDAVRDLGKNGKNELVIPFQDSESEHTTTCTATWSRVYTLQAGTLVDRSAAFKNYYKESLDSLNAEIPKAKADDADQHSGSAICLQMEADKIARFLGASPNAGRDQAMDWVKSGDQYLRRKRFDVLVDIGDQQSIAVLQRYATDSDPIVADEAKSALAAAQKIQSNK